MTKRKLSGGEPAPAKESEAAEAQEQEEQEEQEEEFAPGPIDINPLQFLIAPTDLSKFSSEFWEKKPLHIPADEERKGFFDGLFNFDELARTSDALEAGVLLLMDQDPGPKGDALSLEDDVNDQMCREIGPLMFGRDVVAMRYIDGKRETISGDFADSDTLRSLHESAGATLQLHQPQRFINGLWRLVAALETQVGCLVGCNAYITPKNGQGLAPHHDDVELFVCQTQGSKQWRLYKPVDGFELPSKCSGDLPQEGLGEPLLEVMMKPGDVLYIPRGTVHQAEAQEEGSCHLTISTFQQWTWGSLAGQLIKTASASQGGSPACALPLELRKGLPLGFVFKHGFQAELQATDAAAAAAAARPDAASLASGLRALADQLDKAPVELLTSAVDDLSLDFLLHRIPPHPCQVPDQGEEPTLDDAIACRGKNLFRLVPFEAPEGGMSDDEEEDEEDDEEEEGDKKTALVKLVTCLGNSRFKHMISTDKDDEEDEEDDEEHDQDHAHGMCGIPGCDGSDSDDEGEEEDEEEEEAKDDKKVDKKAAEEEKPVAKGKKGGKKADEEEGKEEEGGDEPEIMEVDVEGEGDDDDDDEGEDGGDSDSEEEEDEEDEEELQGPIFPAIFAPALLEVLSSSLERPLPVKKLKVPGGDPEEQLRLALILHEYGFVSTVPADKVVAEPSPEPKGKAKGKGKAKEEAKEEVKKEEVKVESGKKGKKGGKEEVKEAAKEGEKGGKGGKAKEAAAAKEEAKEKVGGSPPAKKAKKGGK
ncbi:hypothetical protein PLESTB_001610800 [Pleodorina starrii]|uniref:Bifunctional lysine-specific demethylase and histidyl-hydroxylase n=1 Tax=Pleodorina starrii TaxID=330485 RepID=A0A9W6BYG1_9CHLO|nr:hypothetical protein PLESTM_000169700 [Pleodorina starrii]GLC60423.1 hypothetical protein PLESTB_001610800 [Pleodorina starrii]GLC64153.1 hypothetical protein PLESTF_000130300 [Pleodorina starrii]